MTTDLTPRIALVADSPKWPLWLHQRPGRHPQLFTIDLPPLESPSKTDVADAVLSGLGKDARLRLATRPLEQLAAAWLSVTEHTDALIVDATAFPTPLLGDTITMLAGFGIRPWLIVPWGDHHDPDERAGFADGLVDYYDGHLLGPDDLVAAWPDNDTTTEPVTVDTTWPIVPRVDGVVFRSYVHELLDPTEAAFVDNHFVSQVHHFCDLLTNAAPANKSRQFEQHLRDALTDATHDDEAITIARAAQVAGIRHGYRVCVNPVRFHGALSILPRRGHIQRDNWWERLGRYPDPDVPAVAALHMAGMCLDDICHLSTEDVLIHTKDSVTVTGRSGVQFDLVGPPARFVSAAVSWRYLGAGSGSLFATHRADSISDRRIGHLARMPMEIGIRHTGTKAHRSEPSARAWLKNFGIDVHRSTKATAR